MTELGLPEGADSNFYLAAAAAMTMLAVNFEIQNDVLLTRAEAADVLRPSLTGGGEQLKSAPYSAWLSHMVTECERMSAAYIVAGGLDPEQLLHLIPEVIGRAMRMDAVTRLAYLDVVWRPLWPPTVAELGRAEALQMTSVPLRLLPPPPLNTPPAAPGGPGGAS